MMSPRAATITHLNTQADLDRAIRSLVRRDPRLRPVLKTTGMPPLRRFPAGLPGLARIITGQQLSTTSAAAIWGRVDAAFDLSGHDALSRATIDELRHVGLSAAKTTTLKSIANEIRSGQLDLDALGKLDADSAHARLTALHGVGPWTADVYLLFCLGDADAWPAGDIGIQDGIRGGLHLKARPSTKETTQLAEPWRPLRGAAAHLWWANYRAMKRANSSPAVSGKS
jgi:DNA-3-methyladenine glycosylase II